MLGGDSFFLVDCLGMEDPFREDVFPIIFSLHALGDNSSVLSLQLLEYKQHLGGEGCNIPNFSFNKLEY